MLSRYNSITFLTTSLLVTLTSQSSLAFSITPDQPGDSDGTHQYEQHYEYEDGKGFTKLDAWPFPDPRRLLQGQVLEIKPGGTDTLLSQLESRFGHAWEFIPKGNLNGSFNIENYHVCSPKFSCSFEDRNRSNIVGAAFKLNYRPEGDDPTGKNVHWIQRVISNYDIGYDQDGDPILIDDQIHKDRLDIRPDAGSPYYDQSYPGSGPTVFRDWPSATFPYTRTNHYFYAETYLVNKVLGGTVDPVTGIVKNRVEIYSGVRWGWENEFTIPVDLALVFDTSDSMTDEIVPVSSFALDIVNELFAEFPDTKVAITNYRDFPGFSIKNNFFCSNLSFICSPQGSGSGDRPYQAILPFTNIQSSLTNVLSNSFFTRGGGDLPETAYSALINTLQAKDLRGWREDAKKVIIHFTDAAPHDPEPNTGYTAQSVIDAAFHPVTIQQPLSNTQAVGTLNNPVSIYNVYLGQNSSAANLFSQISQQTGGRVYNLDNVGNLIEDLITDISQSDSPDPDPQPVPEFTSVLGLLILGLGGFWQRLKPLKK